MPTEVSLRDSDQNQPASVPPVGERANADSHTDILDVLIALAAGKRFIFWITAGCAALAIAVSFILPKEFDATVTLLPPRQSNSVAGQLMSQLGNLGLSALSGSGLGMKDSTDAYAALLKSRTVEDGMVSTFGLMQEYHARYPSDARIIFEHHVKIDPEKTGGLIRITVRDRDPKRAADLANGYVHQFRKLTDHLAISEAAQRRLFFEQQLLKAKNNLASAEEGLKATELKTGIIQPESQTRSLIQSAAQLQAQIVDKEVQIASMQTYATGENAQLVQAEQELASLRSQLAKLGGMGAGSGADLIVPRGRMSQAQLDYVRKLRDVKYYETIFDILARQFEAAKLDEAREGASIQVVDPAIPPDRRSSPKRALFVVVCTALGFVAAIFYVFFQTTLAHLKHDPRAGQKLSQLRTALGLRGPR